MLGQRLMNERESEASLSVSAESAFARGGGRVSAPFPVSAEEEDSHASHRPEEGPVRRPSSGRSLGGRWEGGLSPGYE